MHIALCDLESAPGSPYSSSRYHATPKLTKEGPDDYEKRTWREKAHFDDKGMLYIPPMAFKNTIAEAAQMLGMRIPGKGTSSYVKHFLAGIQVFDPIPLHVHKDNVDGEWFHCHADGKRGSGKRVMRCFPVVRQWKGKLKVYVVDSTITEDVFVRHIQEAGMLVGVGRFRARNGGLNGRWIVKEVQWQEYAGTAAAA